MVVSQLLQKHRSNTEGKPWPIKAGNKRIQFIFKELAQSQACLKMNPQLSEEFQMPKVAFQ